MSFSEVKASLRIELDNIESWITDSEDGELMACAQAVSPHVLPPNNVAKAAIAIDYNAPILIIRYPNGAPPLCLSPEDTARLAAIKMVRHRLYKSSEDAGGLTAIPGK